jgi:hypothetical protein
MKSPRVVVLSGIPLREVDSNTVDRESNFITEEVHLGDQGRCYRVVAKTRRS